VIDYFLVFFFCNGHEGGLTSHSYARFLEYVHEKMNKHIILIQNISIEAEMKATSWGEER